MLHNEKGLSSEDAKQDSYTCCFHSIVTSSMGPHSHLYNGEQQIHTFFFLLVQVVSKVAVASKLPPQLRLIGSLKNGLLKRIGTPQTRP